MNQWVSRRSVVHAGLAMGVASAAPWVRACEFFTSNLTIIHPWTRASAAGATSAIVSMTFQDVTQSDRLIGAQTPMAEDADIGGDGPTAGLSFVIPQGQTSVLSETGVHLRLLRLTSPLLVGREYPLTLVFAKSGAIRASLTVDYANFG